MGLMLLLTLLILLLALVLVEHLTLGLHHHFTAVPPSTNPKSKLNQLFLEELKCMGLEVLDVADGRVRFRSPGDDSTTPPYRKWPSRLSKTNVKSIRIVVGEYNDLKPNEQMHEQLVDKIINVTEIVAALDTWQAFGNVLPSDDALVSFHLKSRKWESSCLTEMSMDRLTHALNSKIVASITGWTVSKKKRSDAHVSLHALCYNSTLLLEIIALVPSTKIQDLPKPGMKRQESFAVAKSASISANDIVLDPMCGCATFLIEAATHWPDATYIGVDEDLLQLKNAQLNVEATGLAVTLKQGDARHLQQLLLPNKSVDKILCCPPFGRQFGNLKDNKALYQELLREWSRVLADTGTMAVLVDETNLDTLLHAVNKTDCHIDFVRDFFRLGKIRSTIVIVSKTTNTTKRTKYGRFDWEMGHGSSKNRAAWTRIRAESLPGLVPFNAQ